MNDKLDRSKQPKIKTIDKINLITYYKHNLPNGLPIYMVNDKYTPIIKLELIYEAGSFYQEQPFIAYTTNSLLREGTKKYSGKYLSEKIDYYGAYLNLDTDQDWSFVCLYTLDKYFEKLMPYLEQIIFHPTFPENELDIFLKNNKKKFIIENQKVKIKARQTFNKLLYKDHPYGVIVTEEDFDKITKEKIISFYNNNYKQKGIKAIIISGNINDKHYKIIENLLGNTKCCFNNTESKIPKIKENVEKHFEEIESSIQSAIRIGKILFNRKHEDFQKIVILNTILGGYFGSRLMSNLREEKGYTYGIASFVISLRYSGYLVITSEVIAEKTKEALKEIYKEIDKLRNKKVPEKELTIVRNYLIGQIQRGLDGTFNFTEKLRNLILDELDTNYYNTLLKTIKTITPEQLLNIAQRYLNTEKFVEVVVGKMTK